MRRLLQTGLLQTTHVAYLDLQFDAEDLRADLPTGLEPADSHQGFLLLFTAEQPDLDVPRSGGFLGVFLKGRDAPDGSPGIFVSNGFYSFDLAQAQRFSTRFGPGAADVDLNGDVVSASLFMDGAASVQFSARLNRSERMLNLGTHQYIGLRPGGLTTYSLAFAAPIITAELQELAVSAAAQGLLARIGRATVLGAFYAPGAPLTFSPPRDIAVHEPIAAADSAHLAIVEVLASIGRAAVVVSADARLLFGNAQGLLAISPLLRDNRLAPANNDEARQLQRLIADAAEHRPDAKSTRLAVHRPDGSTLLLQAGTYRGGWRGVATALLLIYDPGAEAQIGPVHGLELLGLTPAEARIAAAIGQGLSARGASETLTLAENTVRSALKAIYAKLGIANRAQLAGIVGQLRMPPG